MMVMIERWEYLVRFFNTDNPRITAEQLNEEGAIGWDLVAVDMTTGKAVLKRPVSTSLTEAQDNAD